ncbi:MAG TPA: hypothetical protein VGL61_07940 [Kofleriaceae bacterium]|jgi:hypothetical protein
MSESFSIVQLEPDEHVVFGISLETSSSSFSVQGISVGGSSKEVRKAITDQRVIVEVSTGDVTAVPNGEVKTVTIQREKQMGVDVLRIVSVANAAGQKIGLDLGGIDPGHEARIQQLFPAATLAMKKRGLLSFLGL